MDEKDMDERLEEIADKLSDKLIEWLERKLDIKT